MALIALGVTGGIGAYKAVEVARGLQKRGHDVAAIMTRSATAFVGEVTFEAITRRRVITDQYARGANADIEHIALANGCEMVDGRGTVVMDSPACVTAFALYDDLIRNHSVKGAQDVDTTRATYFAGKAAMMIWSSYILDELAGLRDDAAPSCPQCRADPRFLADNTGIVTALQGPDASQPAQFGEVQSWAVLADANADAATRFVEFMLSDGYPNFLSAAPEGKFPTRSGTPDAPTRYVDLWRTLPAGVDRKVPLAQIYPPQVLAALAGSLGTFRRWGITQGQGALVGATLGELPVPQAIAAMTSGEIDPAQAARQATADVTELQNSLE